MPVPSPAPTIDLPIHFRTDGALQRAGPGQPVVARAVRADAGPLPGADDRPHDPLPSGRRAAAAGPRHTGDGPLRLRHRPRGLLRGGWRAVGARRDTPRDLPPARDPPLMSVGYL